MRTKAGKIFRAILAAAGAVMVVYAVALAFVANFNTGVILVFVLGAVLLAAAWKLSYLLKKRALAWIAGAALALVCGAAIFLLAYGSHDTAGYKEDALIVLGAAIHGETPSGALEKRLEAALRYHEKNPSALIVVSGGQGPQEGIPEAEAMRRWLAERGVPGELIIKEDKATSTYENFKFSKALLDERLGEGSYTAAFVTNAFHIYRAAHLARIVGMNVTHLHAGMNWYEAPAAYLREYAAIIKLWLFKN